MESMDYSENQPVLVSVLAQNVLEGYRLVDPLGNLTAVVVDVHPDGSDTWVTISFADGFNRQFRFGTPLTAYWHLEKRPITVDVLARVVPSDWGEDAGRWCDWEYTFQGLIERVAQRGVALRPPSSDTAILEKLGATNNEQLAAFYHICDGFDALNVSVWPISDLIEMNTRYGQRAQGYVLFSTDRYGDGFLMEASGDELTIYRCPLKDLDPAYFTIEDDNLAQWVDYYAIPVVMG